MLMASIVSLASARFSAVGYFKQSMNSFCSVPDTWACSLLVIYISLLGQSVKTILCRLRVVQANSHSISITHLVVFVKYLSCITSGCVACVLGNSRLCVACIPPVLVDKKQHKKTKCQYDTMSDGEKKTLPKQGQGVEGYLRTKCIE